jgi:hypothetical protein
MKRHIALALIVATATVGLSMVVAPQANAATTRDHRGACDPYSANCSDHRTGGGPVIAPPPQRMPDPGPIVNKDPTPLPPIEPPHPRSPDHDNPYEHDWDYGDQYGISCSEGRQIVRQHGFRHVRTVECFGDIFTYQASSRRNGQATISVDMDGAITDVNYWVARR